MTRWETCRVLTSDPVQMVRRFDTGWEPFTVLGDADGDATEVWFRRPAEGDNRGRATFAAMDNRFAGVEERS